MSDTNITGAATRIRLLTDIRVVATPPSHIYRRARYLGESEAEQLKILERELKAWVKEFHAFMRDHRSQDPVELGVERIEMDACSACHAEWETMDDDGKTCCASCGVEVA